MRKPTQTPISGHYVTIRQYLGVWKVESMSPGMLVLKPSDKVAKAYNMPTVIKYVSDVIENVTEFAG